MKKEISKTALQAFLGGFLGAFFFLCVEHDLTWHNFFVAFIGACIVAIIFGVVRAFALKSEK